MIIKLLTAHERVHRQANRKIKCLSLEEAIPFQERKCQCLGQRKS